MSRKATFSPKRPKENSSDHNSRKEIPNYLIENDPKFDGNYYEKFSPYRSDEQFIELAKKIYNEKFIERVGQNQRMQKKQAGALLWEVAISTEEYHTKEDILTLFKMLKNEKSEQNESKIGLGLSRLKPIAKKSEYVLPQNLRIKRKPKKENLNESGYHILELAGHGDEGHFIRKGMWENLSYYPARDILLKDDGNWYIKSNELSEDKSEDTFDVLADMTEFEKVYNYHWHVKYTNFNIDTGLSAQFSKGEVSGKGRLKKVAEFLDMRYSPEEKIPIGQSVKTIKEHHHIARQNKYTQLMMKFGYKVEMKVAKEKVLKREEILAKKTTNARELKKKFYASEKLVSEQQDTIESLEEKHVALEENIKDLKSENNTLTTTVEDKNTQIISDTQSLTDSQDKIEILEKKVQELEKLLEPTGYEIEGESVSEKLYDYMEKQRRTLNYKSSKVNTLEEKLAYQKERVEARNKLMNEERIRHERVEEKFIEKEESLTEQIQELKKDVFSETWTQKDKNGEKQKSKNINVVKQLEKKTTELHQHIEVLKEKELEPVDIMKIILDTNEGQITLEELLKKHETEMTAKNHDIYDLKEQVTDYEDIFNKSITDYEDGDDVGAEYINNDILTNLAEYLNITPQKLNLLFREDVPLKEDVARHKKILIPSIEMMNEDDVPSSALTP
jgi:hypothetical protein